MTTKARSVLYDLLCILYFVFLIGWIFCLSNIMIFWFWIALVSLLSLFIRPHEYKLGKTRGVILILILSIMVISGVVAYFLGAEPSMNDSLCIIWPAWLQLIVGCCFIAIAVIVLSKLLEDLKIS